MSFMKDALGGEPDKGDREKTVVEGPFSAADSKLAQGLIAVLECAVNGVGHPDSRGVREVGDKVSFGLVGAVMTDGTDDMEAMFEVEVRRVK